MFSAVRVQYTSNIRTSLGSSSLKYLAAKILTVNSTNALQIGLTFSRPLLSGRQALMSRCCPFFVIILLKEVRMACTTASSLGFERLFENVPGAGLGLVHEEDEHEYVHVYPIHLWPFHRKFPSTLTIEFTMCNPPFYSTLKRRCRLG
jgi:hypothetical protein